MVYLGLGSNQGNRLALLEQAVALLAEQAGDIVSQSSVIETEPWGFTTEHLFLNMVVGMETTLSPTRLLNVTQRIERQLGRTHKTSLQRPQYADRPIDIDILLYDNRVVQTSRLSIPHPLMLQREFVWRPLLEIAPEIRYPVTGQLIAEAVGCR